jgi:hydroxymethylbilane synthase
MLKIATRGSLLALAQANHIKGLLQNRGQAAELLVISTRGDEALELNLADNLDKGLFTSEVEAAVASKRADLAVHSLKDMPSETHDLCSAPMVIERETPEDLLIVASNSVGSDASLPLVEGSRVGTSAARRIALLRHYRTDVEAIPIRGNVPTRLKKLVNGEVDALLLARAGLRRLHLNPREFTCFRLHPQRWLPAPGQGAIAVQIHADATELVPIIGAISDASAARQVALERQALSLAEGSCHVAIGAFAQAHEEGRWSLLLGLGGGPNGWQTTRVEGDYEQLAARANQQLKLGKTEVLEGTCWELLQGAP